MFRAVRLTPRDSSSKVHEPVHPPSVLLWCAVRIYRDGLVASLQHEERIGPVAVAATPQACCEIALEASPKVVVIDACSPAASDVASALFGCDIGVVALGIAESVDDVVGLAEAGVSAYLTQEQTLADLVGAIVAVARGESECSPRVTALLLRHVATTAHDRRRPGTRAARLTRREMEILRLLADGLTNKQIGQELSIELPTVKNHVHNVLHKVGAATRGEAVAATRGSTPAVSVDLVGV